MPLCVASINMWLTYGNWLRALLYHNNIFLWETSPSNSSKKRVQPHKDEMKCWCCCIAKGRTEASCFIQSACMNNPLKWPAAELERPVCGLHPLVSLHNCINKQASCFWFLAGVKWKIFVSLSLCSQTEVREWIMHICNQRFTYARWISDLLRGYSNDPAQHINPPFLHAVNCPTRNNLQRSHTSLWGTFSFSKRVIPPSQMMKPPDINC